jgi:uncharacterized membrane protein YqjE
MSDKGNPSLSSNSDAEDESLPALVAQLGENLITLLDTKLSLLKIEIKEDINAYVRNGMFLAIGALILVIGFALLNIAIACLFSSLFENTQLSQPMRYALGFLLTSLTYLIIGALVIVKAKNRLARQHLGPERSLAELEKDKRWLKREL